MDITVTSAEARQILNRLLADVERTGVSVTITSHGRAVAKIVPVHAVHRRFGQLPNMVVPNDFDEPLPAAELDLWE
jgi:prevent-host-death family protein